MGRPRPLIGCATYRKTADQNPPIEVNGLMPSYSDAVRAVGGLPVLIPLGLDEAELDGVLDRVDGLLLPGGGDMEPDLYGGDPNHPTVRDVSEIRDWTEIMLARRAAARKLPLLAICRGLQVLNVALGGSLWEDIQSDMPDALVHDYYRRLHRDYIAHDVEIRPDSHLARALDTTSIGVNSLHHQGIREVAPGLEPVAVSSDGLVEAVELRDHPFAVGVQWHPENLLQAVPAMCGLFRAFVTASANGH